MAAAARTFPPEIIMTRAAQTALAFAAVLVAAQASAQITFYENSDFQGRTFTTRSEVENFARQGFNDRASSVVVQRDSWQVCEDASFGGRCVELREGRYPSLSAMGLNDRVSSARITGGSMAAASGRGGAPGGGYHRRAERLYEAQVLTVRAVVGPPEQRCWVERQEVVQDRGDAKVPGAIVGAVLGGILGHQFGGGVATVGGAVVGGAVGSRVGANHGGQETVTQDVQRCAPAKHANRPEYWDVTYNFRGQEHRVQTAAPPGATITVNELGEPRE
jgi:uncharacterized protein YcfJ